MRIGAEAVAIVSSILLAFSIDAWSERRSDRALEADYLERIDHELRDARIVLDSILLNVDGSLLFAPDLAEFFDGRMAAGDHERLVVAIYKFGLDPLDLGFDGSTYDDLVSTGRLGLISDPEVRQAIQRAYAELQRLAPIGAPYRDEYMAALRALLPSDMRRSIRDACPAYRIYSDCPGLHLDDETVRSIVAQIDKREALLAFRMREQGLGTVRGIGRSILVVLDRTLERLEQ
ncbi:MAG: hypothetical protein OEZ65_15820 [Gemmatimonadota bacterium]|nr:hypothetical protein [Gemmatimonadota bacterium]